MALNNSAHLGSSQEQHKNTSFHSSEATMQNLERIAPHVTSYAGLDFITPLGAYTAAQIMPRVFLSK